MPNTEHPLDPYKRLMANMRVPAPDGTLLGDLRHIVAVYRDHPEDHCLMTASLGLAGPEVAVGLSVGDIRKIHRLLESVFAVMA